MSILYKIDVDDWRKFHKLNRRGDPRRDFKKLNGNLYFEEEELYRSDDDKVGSSKRYFAMGRFFIFIHLGDNKGLKILYRSYDEFFKSDHEVLSNIIYIQKMLCKDGICFDCEEEIFTVNIKDKKSGKKYKFYAYVTHTDVDISRVNEEIHNLKEISKNILDIIYAKHKIGRQYLRSEVLKRKNYVISNIGEVKFIDIDSKFYFINKGIKD